MTRFIIAATVCLAFSSTAAVAKCNGEAEKRALALTIYGEARGEGKKGMRMVGEVVMNRVASPVYPNTVCGVVYQKSQFYGIKVVPKEKGLWNTAQEIAEEILEEDVVAYDHGATHFLNPKAVKSMPRWAKNSRKVDQVGKHAFYKM